MSDIETVREWTRLVLTIAAIPVSAFPLLYLLFSPWYKSQLGRAVMLQALAVAFAVDFSAVYQYWAFTNLYTLVVVRLFMFVFIGVAATYLTIVLIVLNFIKSRKASNDNVKQPAG